MEKSLATYLGVQEKKLVELSLAMRQIGVLAFQVTGKRKERFRRRIFLERYLATTDKCIWMNTQ